MFNFSLKPIEECDPFGTPPDLSLHWFGLTDGYYFVRVGETELFHYTSEILQEWKNHGYSNAALQPYPDYNVVRIYEDLLEILPFILEPVPEEVAHYINPIPQPLEELYSKWLARLDEANLNPKEAEELEDIAETARSWWLQRRLPTSHLNKGPDIWFWRNEDTVQVYWDNRDKLHEGLQVWSTVNGVYTLTVEQFLEEVKDFHERLMQEMRVRVARSCEAWPLTEVKIDLEGLRVEQLSRENSLEVLKYKPHTQWKSVLSAIRQLKLFGANNEMKSC